MKNKFPSINSIRRKKWFSIGLLTALAAVLISSCRCSNKNGSKQLMGSGFGISGATLLVNNLKATRNYYADTLGFDIPKPDEFDTVFDAHISTSIHFADFSSLEFLSVIDTATVDSANTFIK